MGSPLNPQDCHVIELNASLWLTEGPTPTTTLYCRRKMTRSLGIAYDLGPLRAGKSEPCGLWSMLLVSEGLNLCEKGRPVETAQSYIYLISTGYTNFRSSVQ